MMRYNARWESKKNETLTATVDAGIHDFFVLGSMWKTWALHVNIGCSLLYKFQFRKNNDTQIDIIK